MFLIKILVGVACVYLCCKIAVSRANLYKDSYLYYESLLECCNLLLKEFSYKKRPLKALLDSDYISADFNNSIHSYVKNQNYEFPKWLDEKESSRLKNFFEELGKSDVETQKLAINSFKTEFESVLYDKKSEYKKQYTLTLKVGFMVGVMLFIMVI